MSIELLDLIMIWPWDPSVQWSKCVSTGNMAISVLITGTTEKQMWFAEVMLVSFSTHTMVCCDLMNIIMSLSYMHWLSHSEHSFDIICDSPIYRYSMCNGTESRFDSCQLPRSDSSSICPSIATVNCTEGIYASIIE